nr:MAG TPA: hypothetical protein [Caudoviricetes sp.]
MILGKKARKSEEESRARSCLYALRKDIQNDLSDGQALPGVPGLYQQRDA